MAKMTLTKLARSLAGSLSVEGLDAIIAKHSPPKYNNKLLENFMRELPAQINAEIPKPKTFDDLLKKAEETDNDDTGGTKSSRTRTTPDS